MTNDLWTAASVDVEAEEMDRLVTSARVAAVEHWPFLSQANSEVEYVNRKALVEDRLNSIVSSMLPGDPVAFSVVRASLEAGLDEDYAVISATRAEEARKEVAARARVEAGLKAVRDRQARKTAEQETRARVEATLRKKADLSTEDTFVCRYCDFISSREGVGKHIEDAGPQHQENGSVTDQLNDKINRGGSRKTAADQPIPDGCTSRDFVMEQTLAQIGRMNILSISGGRTNPIYKGSRVVGLSLPVAQGYAANVFLRDDDTYVVQRVFRGVVKGEQTNVYSDELGEVVYRAGMYHHDWGGHVKSSKTAGAMGDFALNQIVMFNDQAPGDLAGETGVIEQINFADGTLMISVLGDDPDSSSEVTVSPLIVETTGTSYTGSRKTSEFPPKKKDEAAPAAPAATEPATPAEPAAATRQVDLDAATGEYVGSAWSLSPEDPNTLVQSDETFGKNPRFATEEEGNGWVAEAAAPEEEKEDPAKVEDTTKADPAKTVPPQFEKKTEARRLPFGRSATLHLAASETCSNCGGTGAVPSGGGPSEGEVDDGYVKCSICNGTGSVVTASRKTKAVDMALKLVNRTSASKKISTNVYSGPAHPDYADMVWSDPSVEGQVLAAIEKSDSPEAVVKAIMQVLDSVGYDSMDREMAFWIASQQKGWDYDDLYYSWLNANSKTGSRRTADQSYAEVIKSVPANVLQHLLDTRGAVSQEAKDSIRAELASRSTTGSRRMAAADQHCDWCNEDGHDYTRHPEAVSEAAAWQRQQRAEEFPFGDHHEGRKTSAAEQTVYVADSSDMDNVTNQELLDSALLESLNGKRVNLRFFNDYGVAADYDSGRFGPYSGDMDGLIEFTSDSKGYTFPVDVNAIYSIIRTEEPTDANQMSLFARRTASDSETLEPGQTYRFTVTPTNWLNGQVTGEPKVYVAEFEFEDSYGIHIVQSVGPGVVNQVGRNFSRENLVSIERVGSQQRKADTNPYSTPGNPYVPAQSPPGTPDDVMDGPVNPEPLTLTQPMTTRPRQMPSGDSSMTAQRTWRY